MKIRKIREEELDEVMEIYAYARLFMRKNGNPHQWADSGRPYRSSIENHLRNNCLYCVDDDGIKGVFALKTGMDPTYQVIRGSWLNDEPYVTIHSLAACEGAHGVFDGAVNFARAKCRNIRIDTHEDNKIMQHLILKHGFTYCGIIQTEDGTDRFAYQFADKEIPYDKYKFFIVDYDGTIISSMEMWQHMCSSYLKEQGCVLKEDVDKKALIMTNRETAQFMVSDYLPQYTVPEMEKMMYAYVKDKYVKIPLKKGALSMLQKMKSHGRVVLFSATAISLLEASLNALGIRDYFDEIYSASELCVSKQDGSGYLKVAELEKTEKKDALVVEDAPHAVKGARLVGMDVLGIPDSSNEAYQSLIYSESTYFLREE